MIFCDLHRDLLHNTPKRFLKPIRNPSIRCKRRNKEGSTPFEKLKGRIYTCSKCPFSAGVVYISYSQKKRSFVMVEWRKGHVQTILCPPSTEICLINKSGRQLQLMLLTPVINSLQGELIAEEVLSCTNPSSKPYVMVRCNCSNLLVTENQSGRPKRCHDINTQTPLLGKGQQGH